METSPADRQHREFVEPAHTLPTRSFGKQGSIERQTPLSGGHQFN